MANQATASQAEDIAPFGSVISLLGPGGTRPQDFDLKIYNRDVLIAVQSVNEDATAYMLHLKNVREDTLDEAKTAVNGFFCQFEPLDNGTLGNTVFLMFDRVFKDTKDHVERALLEVDDVKAELVEVEYNDSIYPKTSADTGGEGFNPVAEVMAARDDTLDRVRSIQSKALDYSKGACPNKYARVASKGGYLSHERLEAYIRKESMERSLSCNWYEQSYPGWLTNRHQPIFHVRLDQYEGWMFEYKDYWYSCKEDP